MTFERTVNINGTEYPLVISDDPKTLLMAKAAGRVVVGLGRENSEEWLPVNFVAEGLPIGERWLEGAARRELGIPWKIAETQRLLIREFSVDDCAGIPGDADDSADEAILRDPERLQTYIEEQYAFFDCGMWALVRKEDGRIVGMASLIPALMPDAEELSQGFSGTGSSAQLMKIDARFCEIGFHIYNPYRRCGYVREAGEQIFRLLSERKISVIAHVEPENTASVAMVKNLGFEQVSSDCFLRPYFV